MKTHRALSRSIATLFALAPVGLYAAADTLSGASPAWATAANWSLLAIPGVADNAILAATGTVDLRGSSFNATVPANYTEIQDLTFNSTAALILINNSTSRDMTLGLNGQRGGRLISTTGNFAYTITGTNAAATPHVLTLQLKASGTVDIGANTTTITSVFTESGGAFGINKTGAGTLVLNAVNLNTGTTTVTAGILQVSNATALGSGPVIVNGGSLAPQNLTVANPVTFNGGSLLTRTGNLTNLSGAVAINGATNTILRSFTTPATNQDITVSGVFSGAAAFTIDGNATNTANAFILTNPGNTYSGAFNVSASQILRNLPAATGKTIGTATVNLNGGTLQLRDDSAALAYGNNVVVSTSTSTVDVDHVAANSGNTFNLGTLTIGAQTLNLTGANGYGVSFGATTLTGAAVFNPTTATATLGGTVTGAFPLTKTGAGNLVLAASNNYGGATNIDAGTLTLTGSIATTPRINVKSGATFDVTTTAGGFTLGGTQILSGDGAVAGVVTVASGGRIEAGDQFGAGTLTIGNLTLGTAAGNTATLVVAPSASTLPINVTGLDGLVANGGPGKVTINVGGGNPTVGVHPLVGYNNTSPIGLGSFTLGTLPTQRLAATLQDSGTSIDLNVTGTDAPFWKGTPGDVWNNSPASLNWGLNIGTGPATDFRVSDAVTLDDTATLTNVNVTDTVVPSSVLFSNDTKPYFVGGASPIAGATGLVKTGAAKTAINNVTSTFTGPVSVSAAGTLSVPAVANIGAASPLGAGTTITLDNGTLEFIGASNSSTDRPVVLGAAGGTLSATPTNAAAAISFTGVVSGSGLTKTGPGKVILTTATNTYVTTLISNGILQIGDGVTNGTFGTASTITDNATLAFNNPLAQTVTTEIVGTGALTKTGAGMLVLSGGTANSYAGVTTVSGGNLILSKTSGVNAVGGNVIVETGGTVSYGTTAGQLQDHVPDTASVTVNGGTFGSGAGNTIDAPTAGVTDTVANVTVNSGTFLSGRNSTVTPFTIANAGAGQFTVAGGTALVQRGGGVSAEKVVFTGGALNLDGGSTTAGQVSKLIVGAGGLTLAGTTINFNAGPSALTATSVGSVLTLNGDVTSTGTSALARLNPTVLVATVDLAAAVRTFNVTDTLTIAPDVGAPTTDLAAAGVHKTGPGKLVLEGAQSYASLVNDAGRTDVAKLIGIGTSTVTANAGSVNFGASQTLSSLTVANGAIVTLGLPFGSPSPAPFAAEEGSVGAAAVPEPGSAALLLGGLATLIGMRRRHRTGA